MWEKLHLYVAVEDYILIPHEIYILHLFHFKELNSLFRTGCMWRVDLPIENVTNVRTNPLHQPLWKTRIGVAPLS